MAGGLSRNVIARAINWVFNKTATQPGSTFHISLHTASPGIDGQTANEPSGTGGYARASIAATAFTAASESGALPVGVENTGSLAFAASSAAWSTGATNLTHFGVWDHATNTAAANFIGWGALTTPQAVNAAGVTLTFAAGQLDMTGNQT